MSVNIELFLDKSGCIEFQDSSKTFKELFDRVVVEPTNVSMEDAIEFARNNDFDAYCAVGGGSVMDTAKVANLFGVYREEHN